MLLLSKLHARIMAARRARWATLRRVIFTQHRQLLTLVLLCAAAHLLSSTGSSFVALTPASAGRRVVPRNAGESTLSHMVNDWPDDFFKNRLRVSRPVFARIVDGVSASIKDNLCRNTGLRVSAEFKVATCLYHLAHGGTFHVTADVAGIGTATARKYIIDVCKAIITGPLRKEFMGQPTPARIRACWEEFAVRQGFPRVGLAVDGTHVPWRPDDCMNKEDFHNYKGWHSLLTMAWVNSFYEFVETENGHPGRANDAGVLQFSWFLQQLLQDRDAWLGPDGFVLGDGGTDGVAADIIMTPYDNATTAIKAYFNFCLSSTRFFVEQTFGARLAPATPRSCD